MDENEEVTTEENQEEEKKIAASIVDQLRKSKRLHDQFADKFRTQYKVAGKLMSEWKDHFKVSIPPDLNPQTAQQVDAQLVELHQEATFLKAEAEARYTAYQSANNERYRSKYAALVAEYKANGNKLPAKDTLSALAENATAEIKDSMTHAEIELSFWKDVINDISNSRKLLENATICMATEAKAIQYNSYLDRIGKKEY